ncbi:hypothetical protein B0T21DRAFT_343514 [Apiosordaria backusii]|uniref:DUF7707 domain-containing protein n=1 Tax=Apiosordaria backusii TaxID=314023 RepID=A0AA40EYN4_9PEZI|nr:hypothetical protein B0T21DRAFT_343514 [Apiosordaria backusii]
MVNFRTTVLALAAAVTVSADYWIDPDTVPLSARKAWCNDQRSTCPTICRQTSVGQPLVNDCDADTLTYGCLCSDNKQPNMSEYTLTLPYHVCTAWGTQCVKDCGTNNLCSAACREEHPCGAQSPTRVNETKTATTSTASETSTPTDGIADGFGDGTQNNNNRPGNGAGALALGNAYGLAVVATGLFAGFTMLL